MDYKAIVLAAGQGKRMNAGYNKQLIKLNAIPLIVHSLRLFEQDIRCKGIILVVSEEERKTMQHLVQSFTLQKIEQIVIGGKERQDSVYAALEAMEPATIVLIHDGARPFVSQKVIHGVAAEAAKQGGAIAAVPVKDTIKKVTEGAVRETVQRTHLWAAQTPQGFQYDLIVDAHRQAKAVNELGTDDASLLERQGKRVAIVESDYLNIKLTTAEDLLFAETIIKTKENREHDSNRTRV
ncbi:2-C-methyl-D-erythritol 4-phosphate cytidylyltransferase [Bacillus sp. JCM 19047]|uniref:2-C-methyl-D-erythritol 4-phosphate cytidylyltransferase n=1 Tax=Shouchella miscanthi TaxID=2598861 RepID=A0ABU6NL76_9BACI|nr:2-C-methyl-D-erythritol 4-phosphate cytidylyltransferase [Shouchella miscanthi]MED4128965.1 2-C-methyl-D-erythritol 4-phosphate cytidylyltransferase [Shouchella miscanthi]GAF22562.1 2-C-methyl-D-erythritol 4-phosphate cytidylyltransferase [Bacillus sp. JCM 19047]